MEQPACLYLILIKMARPLVLNRERHIQVHLIQELTGPWVGPAFHIWIGVSILELHGSEILKTMETKARSRMCMLKHKKISILMLVALIGAQQNWLQIM